MDWAQILVIILSVFLALFLVLAIVLVAMLIKVTHQIRKVTQSAGVTVHHIEQLLAGMGKAASPLVFVSFLKDLLKNRSRKGEKNE